MNNDLSSYFEDPEFKDLLAKYEGMVESHTPTYFDAEELTDIAEYYASQGDEHKAEDAIVGHRSLIVILREQSVPSWLVLRARRPRRRW
jgi:hypothetical protein